MQGYWLGTRAVLGRFQGTHCSEVSAQGSAQPDLVTNQHPALRQGSDCTLGPYEAHMKTQTYVRNVFRFPSSTKPL